MFMWEQTGELTNQVFIYSGQDKKNIAIGLIEDLGGYLALPPVSDLGSSDEITVSTAMAKEK